MSDSPRPYNSKDKWMTSILAALLYMLVASPFLYSATNQLTHAFGMTIATNGCPNMAGLILHAIVFMLAVRLLMR